MQKDDIAQAYLLKGNELYETENFQAALIAFNRAIQLVPDYVEALNQKAFT
jgi:tetratricopeptide (TPR) repeat protein